LGGKEFGIGVEGGEFEGLLVMIFSMRDSVVVSCLITVGNFFFLILLIGWS
jgi:hypothetical protein